MNKDRKGWIYISEELPKLIPTGDFGPTVIESSEPILVYLRSEPNRLGQRDKKLCPYAVARYQKTQYDDDTESYDFQIEDESGVAYPVENIIAWMQLHKPLII